MLETYAQLQQLIQSCEADVHKTAGGNRAAGTRVRKQMQEVKALCQELRKQVLEIRDAN